MKIDPHKRFFILVSPSNADGTADTQSDLVTGEVYDNFEDACDMAKIACQDGCPEIVCEVMPLRRFEKVVVDVTEFTKPRRVKR